MTGKRRRPFEAYGAPTLEAVPGARAETVKGAGHVPMYDEPRQVADMILITTTVVRGQPKPCRG